MGRPARSRSAHAARALVVLASLLLGACSFVVDRDALLGEGFRGAAGGPAIMDGGGLDAAGDRDGSSERSDAAPGAEAGATDAAGLDAAGGDGSSHQPDGAPGGDSGLIDAGSDAAPPDPFCGDGVKQTELGEDCDDGEDTADCDGDCTEPSCGDGYPNAAFGESCDEGADNGLPDHCAATCGFECEGRCPLLVDPAAATSGDGSTWSQAQDDLEAALTTAQGFAGEVWVKQGQVVLPPLRLRRGVRLYGGFSGTERRREERPPEGRTVVDGGALNMVIGATGARLEGFTIRGGNANASGIPLNVSGGGLLNDGVTELVISHCTFESNAAIGKGGAIYNKDSEVTIEDSQFIGNDAGPYTMDPPEGGAIYTEGGELTVRRCHFQDNESAATGGAIYNANTTATIESSTFQGNASTGAGFGGGGAIVNSNSAVTITDSRFTANTALGALAGGGAMVNSAGQVTIRNTLFVQNRSDINGSAVRNSGDPRFEGCIFDRNDYANSQAVFEGIGGAVWNGAGSPTFVDCTFTANSGLYGPAAMVNATGARASIVNSLFYGHSNQGPVLQNEGDAKATIVQSTFADNNCANQCNVHSKDTASADIRNSVMHTVEKTVGNVTGSATVTNSCVLFEVGLGGQKRPFATPTDLDGDG